MGTNLTSGGTLEQIVALCTSGVMKPFCDLLDVNDEKTLCVVMDGLVNLLAAAASQGEAEKICEMVEMRRIRQVGGIATTRKRIGLQKSPSYHRNLLCRRR